MPVYHIHGNRDHVLPIGRVQPTETVEGGGHLLPITHASQVNAFLEKVIAEMTQSTDT